MKKQNGFRNRPWLTQTGVLKIDEELKEIVGTWSPNTWASYLNWLESGCHEQLIHPKSYEIICDEQTETIFDLFVQDKSPENRALCEQQLSACTELQADVLRRIYLLGQTEIEVADALNRSQTAVSRLRIRALFRLKRGNPGDKVLPRHIMRGDTFSDPPKKSNVWDRALEFRIKEPRSYDPKNHTEEFGKLPMPEVGMALLRLPVVSQRIIYLRYWCDFSIPRTARELGIGLNVVQDVESASLFKFKTEIATASLESGTKQGVSNGSR